MPRGRVPRYTMREPQRTRREDTEDPEKRSLHHLRSVGFGAWALCGLARGHEFAGPVLTSFVFHGGGHESAEQALGVSFQK